MLAGLNQEEWDMPTICPGWSVKDICLHVLGEDLGWLSRGRDQDMSGLIPKTSDYRAFVEALNAKNQRWVVAARGLSPPVIRELLQYTGSLVDNWHASLDMSGTGYVAWAGPDPVPMWFDLARDLTERWVHQQQIRDALDRPGLNDATYLDPVLRTFIWALPHHYREVEARPGTQLGIRITGPGGGDWSLIRSESGWELDDRPPSHPAASVSLDSDTAWRLFTGALGNPQAVRRSGLHSISKPFLDARGIII